MYRQIYTFAALIAISGGAVAQDAPALGGGSDVPPRIDGDVDLTQVIRELECLNKRLDEFDERITALEKAQPKPTKTKCGHSGNGARARSTQNGKAIRNFSNTTTIVGSNRRARVWREYEPGLVGVSDIREQSNLSARSLGTSFNNGSATFFSNGSGGMLNLPFTVLPNVFHSRSSSQVNSFGTLGSSSEFTTSNSVPIFLTPTFRGSSSSVYASPMVTPGYYMYSTTPGFDQSFATPQATQFSYFLFTPTN